MSARDYAVTIHAGSAHRLFTGSADLADKYTLRLLHLDGSRSEWFIRHDDGPAWAREEGDPPRPLLLDLSLTAEQQSRVDDLEMLVLLVEAA